MSAAVIVKHELPAEIVAIKDETLAEVQALTTEAKALVVNDAASLEQGNALFRRIDALKRGIENGRLEITRPIDTLKGAIIEAERKATQPLEEARGDLGKRLFACQRELERQRQEAERKAREEAEAKARAERERLEKERQEQIRKQQEERAAAEAKAKEEAALFGTEPEPLPPAPEPPPAAVVVPVVEKPMAVATPLPKAAVRGSTRKVLKVIDASKIPREIAGAVLLVPDLKAIRKLMDAGIAVPGCALETEQGFASVGGAA